MVLTNKGSTPALNVLPRIILYPLLKGEKPPGAILHKFPIEQLLRNDAHFGDGDGTSVIVGHDVSLSRNFNIVSRIWNRKVAQAKIKKGGTLKIAGVVNFYYTFKNVRGLTQIEFQILGKDAKGIRPNMEMLSADDVSLHVVRRTVR
ncbi:MAG: hypothetical protein JWR77_449, partial [Rhizorhabdus sp.]|nr:hypothetical protein [Rhizorhabdus sp.]